MKLQKNLVVKASHVDILTIYIAPTAALWAPRLCTICSVLYIVMHEQWLSKTIMAMTMTERFKHPRAHNLRRQSSNHRTRLPRLPNHNSLHHALAPHGRPAPQRRQPALPQTPPQHPPGRLQRIADIPPPQPLRLRLPQDIDNDPAGPERFRIGEADVGVGPAAEGVGRRDRLVREQHGDGDEAVAVVGFEEGGGAGVARLDEAVGCGRQGGCV